MRKTGLKPWQSPLGSDSEHLASPEATPLKAVNLTAQELLEVTVYTTVLQLSGPQAPVVQTQAQG